MCVHTLCIVAWHLQNMTNQRICRINNIVRNCTLRSSRRSMAAVVSSCNIYNTKKFKTSTITSLLNKSSIWVVVKSASPARQRSKNRHQDNRLWNYTRVFFKKKNKDQTDRGLAVEIWASMWFLKDIPVYWFFILETNGFSFVFPWLQIFFFLFKSIVSLLLGTIGDI
jgi:hypothetical protein